VIRFGRDAARRALAQALSQPRRPVPGGRKPSTPRVPRVGRWVL